MISRPPIHRIQVIWQAMRDGYVVNATEFAQQLEVSTMTIRRDIIYMCDTLGFEMQYDGSQFGYVMKQNGCCPFCTGGDAVKRYVFKRKNREQFKIPF